MARILPFYGIIASTLLLVPQADAFIGAIRSRAKDNLIDLVTSGAPDNKVLRALEGVERLSLGSATLSNPLLPGNWLMVWTTSESIAGKSQTGISANQYAS